MVTKQPGPAVNREHATAGLFGPVRASTHPRAEQPGAFEHPSSAPQPLVMRPSAHRPPHGPPTHAVATQRRPRARARAVRARAAAARGPTPQRLLPRRALGHRREVNPPSTPRGLQRPARGRWRCVYTHGLGKYGLHTHSKPKCLTALTRPGRRRLGRRWRADGFSKV